MKLHIPLILLLLAVNLYGYSQTNIICTNITAEQVMKGNYDPGDYAASAITDDHASIICNLKEEISTDSLHKYLEKLGTFHNRNTYSDTVSSTTGIGAARRWVYQKLQRFSIANENRLIPSYLQFDVVNGLCGDGQFRNIFAVLPGADTADHSVLIVEGHMDSRCGDVCDTVCKAHGIDDNGSGTALVLEMTRVMSRFTFKRTLVFMITVGEEQGLYGAKAFAQYAVDENINIMAVQNNDIVGGIVCGETVSPPTDCTFEGQIDSTNVRVFSSGGISYSNRGFARLIRIINEEKVRPISNVAMKVNVMDTEDRSGRGGDHQPFRQQGFTAVRFTSMHEHGNGAGSAPGYTDRQHSTDDILGVDTDMDNEIDSFFIDFNYLKRNIVINGAAMAVVASGPEIPEFQIEDDTVAGLKVVITSTPVYPEYRVGVRGSSSADFEKLYRFSDTTEFVIPGLNSGTTYLISVAAIDSEGRSSIFTPETVSSATVSSATAAEDDLPHAINCQAGSVPPPIDTEDPIIQLLPCAPNPLEDYTEISVKLNKPAGIQSAAIRITDLLGREVKVLNLAIEPGINTVRYEHRGSSGGVYNYSLLLDGEVIQSRQMIIR